MKFLIEGWPVSCAEAEAHWLSSKTFENAAKKTRGRIWKTAVYGDQYGNHNPNGEIEHLEEAGIHLT